MAAHYQTDPAWKQPIGQSSMPTHFAGGLLNAASTVRQRAVSALSPMARARSSKLLGQARLLGIDRIFISF